MDKEKSLFETLTDTVKAAAQSIAHPTEGTPMQMPLNESGYAITHLQAVPKPPAKPSANKKAVKKPAKRAASQKSKSAAGKKGKKAAGKKKPTGKQKKKAVKKVAKKVAKKKKAKKSKR